MTEARTKTWLPPILALLFFMLTNLTAHADCSQEVLNLSHDGFEVKVESYKTESKRHIIIIPPTGGINFLDRSYAKKFCKAGMNAYVLEHWSGDDEYNPELSIHTRFYARAQKAIDLMISHIPGGEYIGILGTSVGGLHTAIAAGRRFEIRSAFVIVGGADIAEIIVTSDQEAMKEAKKRRYKIYGFKNDDQYLGALRSHILLEPLRLTGHQGKKLGMVISTKDIVVPAKNQNMLRRHWKPILVLENTYNHFWAIIKTWAFDQGTITEFFLNH